ncbi:Ig-like domain-containing protein [Telmatospirillum siberiense]|uniref:Ig-like domain-containing protein n=1 Tax=Telmatospirillum siberiense TaxID=382514 RepID=UPI0013044A35|nr:Ig-like domain-containing protein [Telmatospirillum siberiense]
MRLTILPPTITVSPTSLTAGAVGTAYSQTIIAGGGMAPYSFATSVASGSLPPGLSLSSGGVLSGTPTTAGTYSFTVSGTDSSTGGGPVSFTSGTLSLTIYGPPVAGAKTAATAYNTATTIDVSGVITGGPATSVAVAAGPGHGTTSVNGTTITYTPATGYAGSDSFTYTATGPGGTSAPATVSLSVGAPTLSLAPASLATGTVAAAYSQSASASGGAAPYSYSVIAGALPAGLSLTAGGTLFGTPTAAGTFSFTIQAQDSSSGSGPFTVDRAYSLTIAAQAPVAGTKSVAAAYGAATAIDLGSVITGGPATSVAIAATPGHGTAAASGTTITYTPTTGYYGADSFTYTATGPGGTSLAAAVTITVGAPSIAVSPTTLAAGTVATAYGQTLTASGGKSPYSFSTTVASGALPPGLSLSATGLVSGTPTTAGSYSFTVSGTDSSTGSGPATFTSATIAITIGAQAPIAGAKSVTTTYNTAATISLSAAITGGPATSVTVVTGPGHGTAAASGTTVTYTPTSGYAGSDSFTYTATGPGGTSAAATVTITVGAPSITLSPTSLAAGTVATAYSQTFTATGGTAPYSFSLSAGALPSGLALSTAGVLAGTPTAAGTYSFTVRAQDSSTGSGPFAVTQSYSLTIGQAAPVATADTATTAANQAVSIAVTANDANPITSVALASGPTHGTAAVNGLTVLYTPATNFFGTDSFTYKASGPGGTSAAATVTVTVTPLAVPTAGGLTVTTTTNTPVALVATATAQGAPFTGVTLTTNPAHGTATVSGLQILYTPQAGFTGSDSLTYTLANTFGSSTPVTAAITVNVAAQTLRNGAASFTTPTQTPKSITLTSIVPTDSYQSATLAGLSPPNAGTVTIVQTTTQASLADPSSHWLAEMIGVKPAFADSSSGQGFVLTFTPAAGFRGLADLSVSLTSTSGASVAANLFITVGAPSEDPSSDATVIGLLTAQVEAAKRFAQTQISNVQRRLEAMHGRTGATFSNNLHLGFGDQSSHHPHDGLPEDRRQETQASAEAGSFQAETKAAASPDAEWIDQLRQPSDLAFWTGGAANFGRLGSTSSRLGNAHTTLGVTFGVDYRPSPTTLLGIAFGYNRETADIGGTDSRNIAAGYTAALYGTFTPFEATYLDIIGGGGTLGFDSRRALASSTDFALGHRDGQQLFGSVTGSHAWSDDGLKIAPYGRLDASLSRLDGFTESTGGIYALAFSSQSVDTVSSALGLTGSYDVSTAWGLLGPRGRVEYVHDFAGSSTATLSYASDLATTYRATTTPSNHNHALLGVGADLRISATTLSLDYETSFSNQGETDHTLRVHLSTPF